MKLSCLLILFACGAACATPLAFQSSERQATLLELYTSEGCSSCPPAEAWLNKLKYESGLWTDFVPVAFHVDYWNGLGWRDKLSSGEFTERQRDYARDWSAEEVYTPEFVLNGREWRNWSDFRSVPTATATISGTLQASSVDGKHWQVNFRPAQRGTTEYEVAAALLVSELGSDVTAGENSGRHLKHDFAALSLVTRPLAPGTNGFEGTFFLNDLPNGITGRFALAVWITHSGHLEPLQATGGWLPQTKE